MCVTRATRPSRSTRPSPSSRPPTLRRALGPLGAFLAIGLLAGYLIGRDVVATAESPRGRTPAMTTTAARQPSATISDGAAPAGLRASASGGVTRYKFLLMQPDRSTPIRWNPCEPVHYKVSLGPSVPATELPRVRAAFDAVGGALGGVRFVDDGATDVVPDAIDGSVAAGTDIVFAFARSGPGPEGSDLLTGWEAGRGGIAASGVPGADGTLVQRPVGGAVVLDVDKWKDMTPHDRAVLYLHEIGHAVGLDHPHHDRQIMSSGAYDLPARYQPGDLAGLARLGRQAGCTG